MTKPKISLIIITLGLLGIVFLYFKQSGALTSEDAAVALNTETVSSRVTGYVTAVNAENGRGVSAGDVLVTLDPTEYESALAEEKALLAAMQKGAPLAVAKSLNSARAEQPDPAELEARLAMAKEEELSARNEMEYLSTQAAGATLARRREESSANPGNLSALKNMEQVIQGQLNAAKEKLYAASQFRAQTERDLEHVKNIINRMDDEAVITEVLPDEIDAQAARVRKAELDLASTEIIAPMDGQIIMTAVAPGQVVSPGQPLMAVIPTARDRFQVIALFPAELDGKALEGIIKPGEYCEIRLPELDDLEFKGRVDSVDAAGANLFSLQNNAADAKAHGKISVRVTAEHYDSEKMPPLRPNMKAVVSIYPERRAEEPAVNATARE